MNFIIINCQNRTDFNPQVRSELMPKSQLQKQVLTCYKNLLRATKEMPQSQAKVREEFAKGKKIRRMDIHNIGEIAFQDQYLLNFHCAEYKLRYANRRLEKLNTDEVTGSRTFTPKR